jgi:hypothetical protein
MEEGVECVVELLNAKKEVAVVTKSGEESTEICIGVFHRIISCVMEVKAEFCALKPRFFLLDAVDSTDSINQDSLFDMEDVGRALSSPQEEKVILSVSGRRPTDLSKLMLCMQRLTHWHSLFPMNVSSVLCHLQDVITWVFRTELLRLFFQTLF